MFTKVLVANRGEIAVRVIRALDELGIASVAVYSEADRNNHYLKLADYAICIGPGPAQKSYLDISRIVSAAEPFWPQAAPGSATAASTTKTPATRITS